MPLLRLRRGKVMCRTSAAYWVRCVQSSHPISGMARLTLNFRPFPERSAQVRPSSRGLLFRVPSSHIHQVRAMTFRLSQVPAQRRTSKLALHRESSAARVSALLATSPIASTQREASQSFTSFRPQVFTTSRRFTPQSARGSISSRCHVQGLARSGASLSTQPPSLFGRSFLLAVDSARLTRLSPRTHLTEPRLRGLISASSSVPQSRKLTYPVAAPLIEFHPPPGPRLRTEVTSTFPKKHHPLMELPSRVFACALARTRLLQRIFGSNTG
jgi:hypothetical protein